MSTNLPETTDDRTQALVPQKEGDASTLFAEHAKMREDWLNTTPAHNTTLGEGGYPFTIIGAREADLPATTLDVRNNPMVQIGDPIRKIAYLCISQITWWHHDPINDDVEYVKGERFVIFMKPNPIRMADYNRIVSLLKTGVIHNVAIQLLPNKEKGLDPVQTLVSADQWRPLAS